MKLFYYKDPNGNFGDDLNAWLWPRLIPGLLDGDENVLFVGIGSILDERIPPEPLKVVFGTGVGYGRLPAIDERWKICCVRGPLTAQALGLPPDLAITDPAALVSLLLAAHVPKLYPVSFIPHFRTGPRAAGDGVDLEAICAEAGIHYINPGGDVEAVIRDLQSSERVIAEAMHGAIVADALRVPWVAVQLYDHISNLKWWDWCKSLSMEYAPIIYSTSPQAEPAADLAGFLKRLVLNGRPTLSIEGVLAGAMEQLQERLNCLRGDWRATSCFTGSANLVQDPEVLRSVPWLYDIQSALVEIAAVVPVGESFILVDDARWGEGQLLAGRRNIPFLEKDGQYWGAPSDSDTAIFELERLRLAGASFIVFAWPGSWWLDYYAEFNRHLRSNYSVTLETKRLLIFHLRP